MKYFIVTGTSKGLGESVVKQLFHENHTIFCVSRKQNNDLKRLAQENHVNLYYFSCDLQKLEEIEKMMEKILASIDVSNTEGIYLVNNAGVVDPIKPVGKASSREVEANIRVNLIAPMVLTSQFIAHTEGINTEKVIINVSSGAANRPIYGWSTYCSTKAGIDMFTKSAALEQKSAQFGAKVISFSPGVMDTDMQKTIRQSDKTDFADVETFIQYNEQGMLRTPGFVAASLVKLLFSHEIENGKVYDIKNLI
ncbi:(S)-benzoin forming benzil reductase [Cytobacillus sp. S13-E01]|uniref:(S)-benzoin forming benzil reductase n=1 Tax=Cytobacillus sp. S13-E01 TaxID=3031326 RepID=UPI0023D89D26|nr:(S)-benzoin forming benzil reductase [Cytobacillus sp. S13-E01]MDF0728078.1 (S)-benzoin forming benzil reductase [Cytobacillus sp. S13-E01]